MSGAAVVVALVLGVPVLILALKSPEKQQLPDDWIWVRRSATRIARWRAKRNAEERKAMLAGLAPKAAPIVRPEASGGVLRGVFTKAI
jgi:hypothetical protein